MILKQRDLVLLPHPFTNQEGSKVRPAVVVSGERFNKKSEDCVFVPLTTVIKDEPFSILINQEDLEIGKLLKPSRIRIDKIFTAKKSLVIMKIGQIKEETFRKIKKEIDGIF